MDHFHKTNSQLTTCHCHNSRACNLNENKFLRQQQVLRLTVIFSATCWQYSPKLGDPALLLQLENPAPWRYGYLQRQETITLSSGWKHLPGSKELMIAEHNMEQTCSVLDHDQQMSSKNISLCHTATDTMNRNRSKHTAVPSYLPKRWNRGEISRMKACKDNGTC